MVSYLLGIVVAELAAKQMHAKDATNKMNNIHTNTV